MLRLAALFTGMLGCAAVLHAQTPAKPAGKTAADEKGLITVLKAPARPQGVYATIDLKPMEEILQRLNAPARRTGAAREVLKDPASHIPQVFYGVANSISDDRPERAIFWFNVGRIRAVYDALRCKDESARNSVPALGRRLSPDLVRSLHYHRDELLGIARKAIDWDAQNPRNYDQRWICLYGRVAQTSAGADPAEVQVPEIEWPAILKRVHEAHLKGVQDFVAKSAATR